MAGSGDSIVADIELSGDLGNLSSMTDGIVFNLTRPTTDNSLSARFEFTNQQQVDSFVDRLRAGNISIVRLTPQKLNLEDVFLKLIQE